MDPRTFLRIVGSLRFAAVILVMLCIAMACATVYEATHGTPAALIVFYKSWWFEALLWLLAINVLASMLARWPWSRRHAGFLITHASLLGILGGAWVTEHWGVNGQVAIVEGQTAREFTTQQEVLVMQAAGRSDERQLLDLSGGIGGIKPLTRPKTAALQVGTTRARIQQYLPDSQWVERVVEAAADPHVAPSLALEVVVSADGQHSRNWVFADSPRSAGMVSVRSATAEQFAEFLAGPTALPTGDRKVRVEIGGVWHELPLESCMSGPVPVADTSYTIHVLRYLPDARVGENRQLVSSSQRAVNPAIEAEIAGPSGKVRRFAFTRFPEFGKMHGSEEPADAVNLAFEAPVDERGGTAIEVAAAPDGKLAVRFQPEQADAVIRELTLGEPVVTPWPGLQFTVARRFENARREQTIEAPAAVRENRIPAIEVQLEDGPRVQQVWLRRHEPRTVDLDGTRYELVYDNKTIPFGFGIHLREFHIGTYPGTGQPRSFESHVTLIDADGNEEQRVISMNHPADFGSYSLFQSSYQQSQSGPDTTILSVAWDPGMPIVFGAYLTLIAGMLYVLATRMRGRRGQMEASSGEQPPARTDSAVRPTIQVGTTVASATLAMVMAATVLLGSSPAKADAAAGLPQKVDLNAVRGLPVQHDGRWMPLDTVARDTVNAVTGKIHFRGQDPVKLLLAWTFDARQWVNEPLVPIRAAELRRELKLPADRERFSYGELVQHRPLLDQIEHLSHRGRGKMNPLESKVSEINRRLIELQEAFRNEVIRPVPDAASELGAWKPLPLDPPVADATAAAQAAWRDLRRAFLADDATAFNQAAAALATELGKLPAAHRPAAQKLAVELRYNRLRPYTLAWKLMVAGAVFAALALAVRRRWFDAVAIVVMLSGFAALSYGMGLRWQIAGRIPAANMFESLLFLSWGAGAFAIVAMLFLKDRSVPLTASAIGALALFLADNVSLDGFIRPIAPVLLDTVWMSLHVPVIMVSYAVLALAALIAHVQMAVMALAPGNKKLAAHIDAMHYWYVHVGVILLGTGIITGSMWAAFSWGRYWGWDPKEVWSLIAFLAYLIIMHVRVDRERISPWTYGVAALLGIALFAIVAPKLAPLTTTTVLVLVAAAVAAVLFTVLSGQFAGAFKSAVAFWFIIMTYLGVNYVLGIGLHSYGFGTGAVVHYMLLTGSIDLLFIGLLAVIYLLRTRVPNPAGVAAAAP